MIVRDEARVIERCLESCRGVVGALAICDTGSQDGTADLVRGFAQRHALPVEIVAHPWVDFGVNRTRALGVACDLVERLGWPPSHAYLLLLDADQTLTLPASGPATTWDADAYLLAQGNGDERYWNVRLVRADRRLAYVGSTHEYLALPADVRRERLPGLLVTDHNDGGARSDKFERDRRLLSAALERNPSDARAAFYLARTYRALGQRAKALALFRRRIALGGWQEEVWHSWYTIAQLLREAGEPRQARAALLEARRVDPARAEALELLARLHREAGQPRRAAAAARRGLALPFPTERSLFVDRRTYDSGLRVELALAAPDTPHAAGAGDELDALLHDRRVPSAVKRELEDRSLGHARGWPDLCATPLHPRLPDPYVPCNPSVIRDGAGYLVNCRAVNYRQVDARAYSFPEGDGVVRTVNALLRLDADLTLRSQCDLYGAPPTPRRAGVLGFEDLRLLATSRGLLGIAVTADRHPSGLIGLSVLHLEADGRVRSTAPLTGFGHERVEKNWLPYLGPQGEPRLLYALDPLTRLALDPDTGRCRVLEQRALPWDLSRCRGSAGPIDFVFGGQLGELVLVHEVAYAAPWRRRYLHRFVWLEHGGERIARTRAFWFLGLGVEFAAGMCPTHDGDDLLVSFGVEDREAWLTRIPATAVRAALRPV